MNSFLSDNIHGFLNKRSVVHSVECRLNSGVTPASSSSQFSIGVNSTATVGPKLDWASVKLRSAAAPSSMTAAGSLSPAWAIALAVQKNKDRTKIGLAALKP